MTPEEIQAVKETGVCCDKALSWYPEDEGITTMVDGVEHYMVMEWTRGDCKSCKNIYRKAREEVVEEVAEPAIINLDEI